MLLILVLIPMVLAFVIYMLGSRGKVEGANAAFLAGVLEFVLMLYAAVYVQGDLYVPGVLGRGLHFTLDGFRLVYGLVAAFMWMMTLLFSREYMAHEKHRDRYWFFQLMTLGATMGVFLSGDLYTTFVFFEIMSFTSYVWVAQEETKGALKAADTYLAVAVTGGLVLLMGLFLLYHLLGTLDMSKLLDAAMACENKTGLYIAGGCTLVGFGAKAGAFPLHIWLPKAHPVAPAPASALLSGILTKSGIFGILVVGSNIFLRDKGWGTLLLALGLFTMFGGALLAVFSVDLKRTLACSSMSQIGFILIGAGMQGLLGEENGLAVRGTFLHMLNHSLIKLVLFMIAGVVVMNIHKLNLNDIQGFGRKKPFLKLTFLGGALGIGGIPLFNGYVSKTLLHESLVEGRELFLGLGSLSMAEFLRVSEWIFLISGGMTVAYMTKLYVALFVEENRSVMLQREYDRKRDYLGISGKIAIGGSAWIFPVLGMFPNLLTDRIADLGHGFMNFSGEVHRVSYFSFENLKGGFISVGIGALIYLLIRKLQMEKSGTEAYKDCWPKWLDLEELIYRPLLLKILPFIFGVICRLLDSLVDSIVLLLRKTVYRDRKIPHELKEGSVFTHSLGTVLDSFRSLRRRILRQPMPEHEVSYAHRLALKREKIMETNTIIRRSLSFGLLLFYVGLVFTLVYLTWRSFFFNIS